MKKAAVPLHPQQSVCTQKLLDNTAGGCHQESTFHKTVRSSVAPFTASTSQPLRGPSLKKDEFLDEFKYFEGRNLLEDVENQQNGSHPFDEQKLVTKRHLSKEPEILQVNFEQELESCNISNLRIEGALLRRERSGTASHKQQKEPVTSLNYTKSNADLLQESLIAQSKNRESGRGEEPSNMRESTPKGEAMQV